MLAVDLSPLQGVTLERMTEVGMVESPTALGTGQVLPQITEIVSGTIDTGWQVSYSRVISFTPAGGDPVAFPVDGPDARPDVYVSMDGQVIGARGGWRELEEVATLDTVEVLAPDRMNQLFTVLEPIVNLLHTPFAAHDVVIAGSTLGYFEREAGATQTTLLPVYMLDLSFRDEGGQELTRSVGYVPVAPELMSPPANITSLDEEGTLAMVGDVLTLTAADASQPLSALGYGDDLDFALGRPPYTYTWYLNDTPLGQGRSLNYTVAAGDVPTSQKGGAPLRITLAVEDGNGNRSVSSRSVQVLGLTLGARRYLPVIRAR